jgi:hypothetical protein
MGRSGNIGWGLSNYFGLTNRKRKLLTKEFLQDFRDELIKLDMMYNEKYGRPNLDYNNETYMGFYGQVESSYLFYDALKTTCEKHNLVKAIYQYAKKLPWYDSDCFDDNLVTEMIDKGIIKYDRPEDYEPLYDVDELEKAKYKIIQHFKGYNVVEYGSWFDDSRKDLEDIYKDGNWELIWLN